MPLDSMRGEAGGFIIEIAFIMGLDALLPHLHLGEKKPEGMAVGLSFALASQHGSEAAALSAAVALALGLRNF